MNSSFSRPIPGNGRPKPTRVPYGVSMGGMRGARVGVKLGLTQVPSFFPGLSIVGVIFGLGVALLLMPENLRVPGALRPSAIAMILGLAVGPLAAASVNLRFLLRTENIIGLAPCYWLMLDMVTGSYEMEFVKIEGMRTAFVSIALFTCAFWWGTMSRPWQLPVTFLRACQFRVATEALMPVILLCFTLAMLRYAIPCKFDLLLMIRSVSASRWEVPWGRGALGGWDAFTDHLTYFGYLLPTLAVLMARRRSWFHLSTIIAILCALIFMVFLSQSGARRIVGVCIGAAMLFWILDQKKINPWQMLLAGTGVVALVVLMQMMVLTRSIGIGQVGLERAGRAAISSIEGNKVSGAPISGIHVDDNILRLAQTMQIIPDKLDYVYHKQLFYILVRPIPRALWRGKPEDPGFQLQHIIGTQAILTFTIVGEFWISLGYFAVLVGGWFYGRLATLSSPLFYGSSDTMAPMFYGYMTMTMFVGYRSLVEVLLFSYAILGWWFVTWLIRKMK